MEIVWSESSLLRLAEIGNFIAKDSPRHVHEFVDRLIESVERLKEFPLSGALVFENPAFRQIVVQGYRVIYRVRPEKVEIVTVFGLGREG